jgi:hypothetical protein
LTHKPIRFCAPLLLLAMMIGTGTAQAQLGRPTHRYTATLLGGIGGSSSDITNPTLQLGWSIITDRATHFGVRVGHIGFSSKSQVGDLLGPDLTYITLAGEYRFQETFYQSGMFFGLGYYDLNGDNVIGGDDGDDGIGLTFGVNGEFDIDQRWAVVVELAGHWVDLESTDLFGSGLVGLALRF